MDILQLISEQTPAVALALVVMWFYNKLVLDILKERKEMTESLRLERREWLDSTRTINQQLMEINKASIESAIKNTNEVHNLRITITEFLYALDGKTAKRGGGQS